MMVEIQGNPDNEELVEIYLISLTKKLGLSARKTGEIIVKFTKKMPNGFGDALGICEGDHTEAIIHIAKKQNYFEQMRTLAHEMVHAKQFMKGQYPSEREAVKMEFDLFGRCFPWERVK